MNNSEIIQNTITVSRYVSNGEILFIAIGYTVIFLMLMLVTSTYILAWKTSNPRSRGILALALFFMACNIQIGYNAIVNWVFLVDRHLLVPQWTQYRVITLFLATFFVLHTAWHRSRPIKVIEVKKDEAPRRRIDDI